MTDTIAPATTVGDGAVTMTERAARRLAEIAAGDPSKPILRVAVEGGGCSGFQYIFSLVAAPEADDIVIARDGARAVIDAMSIAYMTGSEIDFVDDLIGATFRIHNPQATASCGCGTSFTI